MKSIQAQGKNVQKAIENGLKELNVSQDEVSIKILDEGGLFRKAKVELTLDNYVEEPEVKEPQIKDEEKPVEQQEISTKKEDKNLEKTQEENSKKSTEENSHIAVNKQDIQNFGKEFLLGLFKEMSVEATIETFESELGITFNASGEKVSALIGKRGETLNAIQEVLTNVLKNAGYRDQKVFFDVENYKNRRELSLINLAERMAAKALKINKPIKLEKMSAYERKIVHTAIQNMEGVTSKSEGEEPNRYLCIIPTKKD